MLNNSRLDWTAFRDRFYLHWNESRLGPCRGWGVEVIRTFSDFKIDIKTYFSKDYFQSFWCWRRREHYLRGARNRSEVDGTEPERRTAAGDDSRDGCGQLWDCWLPGGTVSCQKPGWLYRLHRNLWSWWRGKVLTTSWGMILRKLSECSTPTKTGERAEEIVGLVSNTACCSGSSQRTSWWRWW